MTDSQRHPADDNFYLRTLLGEEAFLAPLGGLDRRHLERAKAVLDQFSVVIILEKFEEQLVQLQEAFQWTVSKRLIYK